MAKYTQEGRALELSTPLGKDLLLLEGFVGKEAISQLFLFQLDLLAENAQAIAFDKLLGQKVRIRLSLGGSKNRFLHGIVSRFSQGARDPVFTHYKAEVVPHVWLLTKRSQSRIFQRLSVPDILKKVLAGIDVGYELLGTFHPREYCVQYRESDFQFISRLMEEEGIFYFFKHTLDGHKMIVANTPQSHPDLPEQSKVIYQEAGGTRVRCRITEWEKVQEVRSGKYTVRDHSFEVPDKSLEANKIILDSVQVGSVPHKLKVAGNENLEIYDYPGGFAQRFHGIDKGGGERPAELQKLHEENQRTAEIRMQQEALPGLVIQGVSHCRQFSSGHKFNLDRHFNADGAYVITGVEHSARQVGDYRSGEKLGFVYQNRFTCIPHALPYRPPLLTPRPRIEGTQTAVVVGPAGEEIFTDKYGRVKVQFHWDRQGKKDPDSSCWCRVGTIWAGNRRGVIHVPLVGDEVIVDFLEGDPDRPIIIGSVYNANLMPPFPLPENKTMTGYKDRSGSNVLRVESSKAKGVFYHLHADKDFNVDVDNDEKITVKGNSELIVDGNRFVRTPYCQVHAKKIDLVGEEEIQLLTPDAKIIIGHGVITIQASQVVKINC